MGITDWIGALSEFPKVVRQRTLCDHSHAFPNGKGQNCVDAVLVRYVYGDLDSLELAGLYGMECSGPLTAIPDEADLSRFAGAVQYLEHFHFLQSLFRATVEKQQVNVVGLQAAEAPMDAPFDGAWMPVQRLVLFFPPRPTPQLALHAHKKSIRTAPGRKTSPAFRTNQISLAPAAKSAADFFFAVAVHGGRVNQIDAPFKGGVKHTIQDFAGYVREADICATKPQCADVQSSPAKRPEFDGSQRGLLCGATWDH